MPRTVLRLLALPAAVAIGVAVATTDPAALAGAERTTDADLYAIANDPQLTAANHELTVQLEEVAARTVLKDDAIDRLLAGRIGLAAAADEFLHLNESSELSLSMMRHYFPASDDRESAARNVLEYVRLRTPPADVTRVRDRMADEYRAAFHHAPRQ